MTTSPLARLCVLAAGLFAGLAIVSPANAIVGGQEASRPYPAMATLETRGSEGGDFSFACGGSLVAPQVVLTAAHCVVEEGADRRPEDFRVTLGRSRLSATGEQHAVVSLESHERYRATGVTHDVALLKLDRPSGLAPIRIVGAAERDRWAAGVDATVIGFGARFSGDPVGPDELREVQVPIRSDADCEGSAALAAGQYDPVSMICAGEDTGMRDSCQGDSGGPLMVPDAQGALVQAGVVSFGVGCALPTQYGVYARIGDADLRGWLAARLPADAPAGSAGGSGGSGGSSTPAAAARLSVASRLGSARRRPVRVRIRTTRPLTRVTVTVRRGGRLVASARRSRVSRRATVRLAVRRRPRAGSVRVTVAGRDAEGRRVKRVVTARFSR